MEESKVGHGRASGKVILFGEHAVVYGVPAIAAGLDRGARATAHILDKDEIVLQGETLPAGHKMLAALSLVRQKFVVPPARVKLILEIPAGAGLGASAALGVATIRALGDLHDKPLTDRTLHTLGQTWERVFHGNPSGVDVAAAQHCRPIRFQKGTGTEDLLIKRPLRLLVAQAGPPESTKEMVDAVARLRTRNRAQFDKSLDGIAALVENAALLLRSGDLGAVGKLMDLNHMLLAGWMLSTEEIEHACALARGEGALGAKLTGAGGGGSVIALCGQAHEEAAEACAARIMAAWARARIPHFAAEVRGEEQLVTP